MSRRARLAIIGIGNTIAGDDGVGVLVAERLRRILLHALDHQTGDLRFALFEEDFGGVHRYMTAIYNGRNPYMVALEKNIFYLKRLMRGESWPLLRRKPPCILAEGETVEKTRRMVADRLRELRRRAA